jgi:hypothetical protein
MRFDGREKKTFFVTSANHTIHRLILSGRLQDALDELHFGRLDVVLEDLANISSFCFRALQCAVVKWMETAEPLMFKSAIDGPKRLWAMGRCEMVQLNSVLPDHRVNTNTKGPDIGLFPIVTLKQR